MQAAYNDSYLRLLLCSDLSTNRGSEVKKAGWGGGRVNQTQDFHSVDRGLCPMLNHDAVTFMTQLPHQFSSIT